MMLAGWKGELDICPREYVSGGGLRCGKRGATYEVQSLHLDWGYPMLWRRGRMSLRCLKQGYVSNFVSSRVRSKGKEKTDQ